MTVTPEQIRFLRAWQSSPSVEAAAEVLGAKPIAVRRRADRWRKKGVNLKRMTPPRAPRRAPDNSPLTQSQREFMAKHYDYALSAGCRAARRLEVAEHKTLDIVEDAAVTALIAVARRSTDLDFDASRPRAFLFTAVFRQVRNTFAKYYGGGHRKNSPNEAAHGPVDWSPNRHSPNPVQVAIEREEQLLCAPIAERAKAIIGEVSDIRKANGEHNEFAVLLKLARRFGVKRSGPIEKMRQDIASHVREMLARPPASEPEPESPAKDHVPESIRRRLHPVQPKSAAQRRAERFVRVWEHSLSMQEVAKRLGQSMTKVVNYSRFLVDLGVNLTPLPTDYNSVIRGVLQLRPSVN